MIAERCCDPAFGLDAAARQLAVSRRYVQFLLEDPGASFVGHLTEHRLRRAHHARRPAMRHRHVIDIAPAVGFGDVSHFNRLFRRRFGETPTGLRAAAARDGG